MCYNLCPSCLAWTRNLFIIIVCDELFLNQSINQSSNNLLLVFKVALHLTQQTSGQRWPCLELSSCGSYGSSLQPSLRSSTTPLQKLALIKVFTQIQFIVCDHWQKTKDILQLFLLLFSICLMSSIKQI